jgi:hypothetical protein
MESIGLLVGGSFGNSLFSWAREPRENALMGACPELRPCLPGSSGVDYDKSARDHRSMKCWQLVSIFSRRRMLGRVALLALAVLALLSAPSRASAQDAGVSGIPPGPANARGLNGSVNDPSGIGNATRVPAIPPPTISPAIPPTLSAPAATRTSPTRGAGRTRRTRVAGSRLRGMPRAPISKQDRLLDHQIQGICRGC